MLKCLVVDDERRARRTLTGLIDEFCPGAEVVGAAASVEQALAAIAELRPEVVFLDVSMPGRSGFAVAERPELADLAFVFVTAHADYAVEAFRVDAVDYLLKPVDVGLLRGALDRAAERVGQRRPESRASLIVYANNQRLVVPLREIEYLEAEGSYTYVVTAAERLLVSRRLGDVGEGLEAQGFFRAHRSFLINVANVKAVGPASKPCIVMQSGAEVALSRYRRGALMDLLR